MSTIISIMQIMRMLHKRPSRIWAGMWVPRGLCESIVVDRAIAVTLLQVDPQHESYTKEHKANILAHYRNSSLRSITEMNHDPGFSP